MRAFIYGFTSQKPVMSGTGPILGQKPGTQLSSPMWVAGVQLLHLSLLAPRICRSMESARVRNQGTKPSYSSLACGHLNCWVKHLLPIFSQLECLTYFCASSFLVLLHFENTLEIQGERQAKNHQCNCHSNEDGIVNAKTACGIHCRNIYQNTQQANRFQTFLG